MGLFISNAHLPSRPDWAAVATTVAATRSAVNPNRMSISPSVLRRPCRRAGFTAPAPAVTVIYRIRADMNAADSRPLPRWAALLVVRAGPGNLDDCLRGGQEASLTLLARDHPQQARSPTQIPAAAA